MSLEQPPTPPQFDTILGRAGYTVPEFCAAHRLSRGKLYDLWSRDLGPRRIYVGNKIVISIEAAADWRRAMEQRSAATVAA
jgi:hypothetical protein